MSAVSADQRLAGSIPLRCTEEQRALQPLSMPGQA
jgi:hypothetical protein